MSDISRSDPKTEIKDKMSESGRKPQAPATGEDRPQRAEDKVADGMSKAGHHPNQPGTGSGKA